MLRNQRRYFRSPVRETKRERVVTGFEYLFVTDFVTKKTKLQKYALTCINTFTICLV